MKLRHFRVKVFFRFFLAFTLQFTLFRVVAFFRVKKETSNQHKFMPKKNDKRHCERMQSENRSSSYYCYYLHNNNNSRSDFAFQYRLRLFDEILFIVLASGLLQALSVARRNRERERERAKVGTGENSEGKFFCATKKCIFNSVS